MRTRYHAYRKFAVTLQLSHSMIMPDTLYLAYCYFSVANYFPGNEELFIYYGFSDGVERVQFRKKSRRTQNTRGLS